MKVTAKQYAQCLYELIDSAAETEIKNILKKFVILLNKHRDLNLTPDIINNFSEIWNREHGELVAELTSARELKNEAKEAVINYLKNKSGAEKIILDEQIDKNILGGFILKYDSKIIDGSLKNGLRELKNSLIA